GPGRRGPRRRGHPPPGPRPGPGGGPPGPGAARPGPPGLRLLERRRRPPPGDPRGGARPPRGRAERLSGHRLRRNRVVRRVATGREAPGRAEVVDGKGRWAQTAPRRPLLPPLILALRPYRGALTGPQRHDRQGRRAGRPSVPAGPRRGSAAVAVEQAGEGGAGADHVR